MNKKKNSTRNRRGRGANNWPLLALLGGGLLVLLALFALRPGRSAVEVSGQARLKADQQKIDLGTVRLGTPVTTQFVLTNVGDQPLVFSQEPYVEVVEGC